MPVIVTKWLCYIKRDWLIRFPSMEQNPVLLSYKIRPGTSKSFIYMHSYEQTKSRFGAISGMGTAS